MKASGAQIGTVHRCLEMFAAKRIRLGWIRTEPKMQESGIVGGNAGIFEQGLQEGACGVGLLPPLQLECVAQSPLPGCGWVLETFDHMPVQAQRGRCWGAENSVQVSLPAEFCQFLDQREPLRGGTLRR